MYKFFFNQVNHPYELREMIRTFLPPSSFEILEAESSEENLIRIPDSIRDKNKGKQYLYDQLSAITGLRPNWGILTGVRPVKLTGEFLSNGLSLQETKQKLIEEYYLNPAKAQLLLDTWDTQQQALMKSKENTIGLYIGIPFCPSRCLYCSFPSYQRKYAEIQRYLLALEKEIDFVSKEIKQKGWEIESIYIGGGTPTTLEATELSHLMKLIKNRFSLQSVREFTVEAGRPDTITKEKLEVIKSHGADRISINPQTMNKATLERIGRAHSPDDVRKAFLLARAVGFSVINADLIAGLPGEDSSIFETSLYEVLNLVPENLTVHTLALKRASKLAEIDGEYHFHQGQTVGDMLNLGSAMLKKAGYRPYYLYRQKQMTGNHENVGYSLPLKESLYNIRIMEENQTIVALGAGGISKLWYPAENRLERIPNVSNYEIYIDRIDEMIIRKQQNMFQVRGGNESE